MIEKDDRNCGSSFLWFLTKFIVLYDYTCKTFSKELNAKRNSFK